jgi:hypothetical protein
MILRAVQYPGVFTGSGFPNIWGPYFLGANLVGWWSGDQGLTANGSNQITAWTDLSGAGNTLGNATPANSLIENVASLNGLPGLAPPTTNPTQEYSVVSTAAITSLGFNLATPYTLSAVIRRQPTGGVQRTNELILSNNTTTAFAGWQLGTGSTYANTLSLRVTAATGMFLVHGSTALTSGTAYSLIVTYDGSGSAAGLQFYVNGVAETMTVITNTAVGSVTNGPLVVGSGANNSFQNADTIYEVPIFNVKLTAAQITSLNAYFRSKWAF